MGLCQKEHRYLPDFSNLSDSQDNQNGDRHICAGCAYAAGLEDGLSGCAKKSDLSYLPYSQAGTVRHKDAMEAYKMGYAEGKKRNS
ncbi:MAG: hypothetical protein GXZ02_02960 [Clostridiales bacterium]|nr:hypothetical protein [Clostridiales bacterium]